MSSHYAKPENALRKAEGECRAVPVQGCVGLWRGFCVCVHLSHTTSSTTTTRADLLKVGKDLQALKTLHGILTSRRHRQWQPTHEKIMTMYVDLSVALRKNMKDAFVQYRMICQQVMRSAVCWFSRVQCHELTRLCVSPLRSIDQHEFAGENTDLLSDGGGEAHAGGAGQGQLVRGA